MTKPKSKKTTAPSRAHHLDRRTDQALAAPEAAGNDDDLLTTTEMCEWFKMSSQWFEIGRCKGYGPPFERLAPTVIRYRRGDVRAWLKERAFTHSAQYKEKFTAGRKGETLSDDIDSDDIDSLRKKVVTLQSKNRRLKEELVHYRWALADISPEGLRDAAKQWVKRLKAKRTSRATPK